MSSARASAAADRQIEGLRIKTSSRDAAVRTLSGGNQQKVVIGKWLNAEPDIFVLDEPTGGVDIGSKAEIIALVRDLAARGKAVLVISSELSELLTASDRILVMSDGRIASESARTPSTTPTPTTMSGSNCNSPSASFPRSFSELTPMSDTTGRPSFVGPLVANWRQYIPYLGFVLIFAFFSATLFNQGFLEPNNQLNILRQTAMISIMSVGMTYVLSAGEIDLSIGMVAGLISCVVAVAMDHFGAVTGVFAGLAAGGFVGLVNGALTTRVGIPSFLTTLAMMGIARGTAMWMTSTKSVPILDDDYIWLFGGGNLGPIPVLVLWTVVVGVVGHVVLRRTTFGRRVLATGGSETAARYSGIDTRGIKMRVLIISSLGAALAGMLYAGRLHSGRFQLGEGDELSVIAAAVLGGTSLFGGAGTVVGSIVGSLMIGVINNGLLLMGLEYSQQLIARGVIIIIAVAISQSRK